MTFEDREEMELCGVLYKATRQQANEIMSILIERPEWREYAITNDRIRYGELPATGAESVRLFERHVDNYRAAFKVTRQIVDDYFANLTS